VAASAEEEQMRSNRARLILAVALALVSGPAAAAEEAASPEAAPAEAAPPAAAQPTPKVSAARPVAAAAAPRWREGFMFIPAIGINSFQGSSAENVGPGLRLSALAGSRVVENVSLNVGFAFDLVNIDAPAGVDASQYVFDLGFNPLFHLPLEQLEILAGPVGGVFLNKGTLGPADTWVYGWTAGANLGTFFRVSPNVRLGGLINFSLRNPIKACVSANGSESCESNGLTSAKVLSLAFAAML
jgi:hypothetical protein